MEPEGERRAGAVRIDFAGEEPAPLCPQEEVLRSRLILVPAAGVHIAGGTDAPLVAVISVILIPVA